MIKTMVEHKVKDFNTFSRVFDEHRDMITRFGGSNSSIGRDRKDPNNITIISDFKDQKSFKDMWNSNELKTALKDAGVASDPKITYLEEKGRG